MKNYRLSPASQEDLRKIKAYSLTTWGKRQTQSYIADMKAALEQLVLSPDLGKKRDDLVVGLRSFQIRQHLIFYRCREELEVVRILHGRMDIPACFKSH